MDHFTATQSPDWVPHTREGFVGGMGQVFERRRDGLIEIALQTDDTHRNLKGVAHGGVIMTLIDRAIGIHCREAAPKGVHMATASLTVNFLRPIVVGDFVEIRCQVRKSGRKAIYADASATVGGRLVATASGVWLRVD